MNWRGSKTQPPPPLPQLEKRTGLIQVSPKIFINKEGPPTIRLVEREKEREKFKILPPPLLLVTSSLRFNRCKSHTVQLIPSKYSIQSYSVKPRSCATIIQLILGHFHHFLKRTLGFSHQPHPPPMSSLPSSGQPQISLFLSL